MDYIELKCQIKPFSQEISEIVVAQLNEIDYESFTNENDLIYAYIKEPLFDLNKLESLLINQLQNLSSKIEYSHKRVENQDWNAIWESNFQPVIIENKVVIRASFHTNTPKVPYEIVIDPRMSFGTGHHSTTSLMIQTILETPMEDKDILDMGCGTSILGIMASLRGANQITAIDIDEWPYKNSLDNIKINGIENIKVLLGDASLLKDKHFDIIFANINRNILLNDIKHYTRCLSSKGILIMSGFYTQDLDIIKSEAKLYGMKYYNHKCDKNWVAVKFIKI